MKSRDFVALQNPSDKPKPFSIRLTDAERAALQARAGGRPLGSFIREALLEGPAARRKRQSPVRDGDALGRLLGLLGQSEVGPNLRRLAAQADAGSLYCDQHTKAGLDAACNAVRDMRRLLLAALGKEILGEILPGPDDLSGVFNLTAAPGIEP